MRVESSKETPITAGPMVKAILGYNIVEDLTESEYQAWLWDVHYPDLLANPHLDKVVFNNVIRPIETTSAGTPVMDKPETFYAIAELHFADKAAYERYVQWFVENPIPPERSPEGRSDFKFYVLTEVREANRESPADGS